MEDMRTFAEAIGSVMSRRVIIVITISEPMPNACRIRRDREWVAPTSNCTKKYKICIFYIT